jgi:hypothetical protein
MDPAPDPAILVLDLQDSNKKLYFSPSFSAYYFLKGTFISFFKDNKVIKKTQNSRNQGFSYYFCLTIAGPLPNGSERPKKQRIRIHNTAGYSLHKNTKTN